LAQRHFGIEPLGLLRFANIAPPGLLAGLEARFEGVGDPEWTRLHVTTPDCIVLDRRLGFFTHTWIHEADICDDLGHQRVYQQQCRRLQFLARKLVTDLESAEKILVYDRVQGLTDTEIASLFTAVRRYGPNTLLCVNPSSERHPSGTVEIIEPGLMLGFLEPHRPPSQAEALYARWEGLCRIAEYVSRPWRRVMAES
jgi:hypothetical protein